MSIDLKLVSESSSELFDKLEKPVSELGHTNLRISYNKTLFEREQNSVLYVSVEYKRLLWETKEKKATLRKIVPKTFEYQGLVSQVKLEFAQLPSRVKNQLREVRKYS